MIDFALWDQEKSKVRFLDWKKRRKSEASTETNLKANLERKKTMIVNTREPKSVINELEKYSIKFASSPSDQAFSGNYSHYNPKTKFAFTDNYDSKKLPLLLGKFYKAKKRLKSLTQNLTLNEILKKKNSMKKLSAIESESGNVSHASPVWRKNKTLGNLGKSEIGIVASKVIDLSESIDMPGSSKEMVLFSQQQQQQFQIQRPTSSQQRPLSSVSPNNMAATKEASQKSQNASQQITNPPSINDDKLPSLEKIFFIDRSERCNKIHKQMLLSLEIEKKKFDSLVERRQNAENKLRGLLQETSHLDGILTQAVVPDVEVKLVENIKKTKEKLLQATVMTDCLKHMCKVRRSDLRYTKFPVLEQLIIVPKLSLAIHKSLFNLGLDGKELERIFFQQSSLKDARNKRKDILHNHEKNHAIFEKKEELAYEYMSIEKEFIEKQKTVELERRVKERLDNLKRLQEEQYHSNTIKRTYLSELNGMTEKFSKLKIKTKILSDQNDFVDYYKDLRNLNELWRERSEESLQKINDKKMQIEQLSQKLRHLKSNKKLSYTPLTKDLNQTNLGFPSVDSRNLLLDTEFTSTKFLLNDLVKNEHIRHNDKFQIKIGKEILNVSGSNLIIESILRRIKKFEETALVNMNSKELMQKCEELKIQNNFVKIFELISECLLSINKNSLNIIRPKLIQQNTFLSVNTKGGAANSEDRLLSPTQFLRSPKRTRSSVTTSQNGGN